MSALPPEADMLIVGINVCSATSRRHPIGPEPLTHQYPQAAIRSQHRRAACDDRTPVLLRHSAGPRAASIAGMSA